MVEKDSSKKISLQANFTYIFIIFHAQNSRKYKLPKNFHGITKISIEINDCPTFV